MMKLTVNKSLLGKQLPRPQLGINMWSQGAKAFLITQEVDTFGNVQDVENPFDMLSVIQPLKPEEVKLKPEGQWAWPWYWFHTKPDVDLKQNDRIIYKNEKYKIMTIKNYSDYGHIEYHCIKDWQNAS